MVNSDIADIAKWARAQQWTVEDDTKGYTRFYNPAGAYIANYPAALGRISNPTIPNSSKSARLSRRSRSTEQPLPAPPGPAREPQESRAALASAEQERTTITAQEGRHKVTANDWVITFTFDVDPTMETMDLWENRLAGFDASVARIPGRGVDVTAYAPGELSMADAINKTIGEIAHVVRQGPPEGLEIVRESEWRRRAEAPTMPELMSAAEIAAELGVRRQRVHQLRSTAAFPAPLAELRGGAVWDAAAVRKFAHDWARKPGRPRTKVSG